MFASFPCSEQVTVIIVTYNSAHCIRALASTLANLPNIIVIDNASHDGTLEAIRHHVGHARIIANTANIGFGAANNRGLTHTTTPFALLLNPDCDMSVEAVEQLARTATAYPEAAMVVPQIVQSSGVADVNYHWGATMWKGKGPAADGVCCVGFACGAAWLVRMSIWRQVGGFDESFFLYYEDDDVCQRMLNQRLSILLDPAVRVVHRSRGSVGGQRRWRSEYLRGYHHAQSKIFFARKYKKPHAARRLYWQTLTLAALSMPLRVLLVSPQHIARFAGRVAGLIRLGFTGNPPS